MMHQCTYCWKLTVWRMKPCYREKEERKVTPDDREAQCTVAVNSARSIFKTITI